MKDKKLLSIAAIGGLLYLLYGYVIELAAVINIALMPWRDALESLR